eukprot:906489-Pelagomonas_calceolata.AAC.3
MVSIRDQGMDCAENSPYWPLATCVNASVIKHIPKIARGKVGTFECMVKVVGKGALQAQASLLLANPSSKMPPFPPIPPPHPPAVATQGVSTIPALNSARLSICDGIWPHFLSVQLLHGQKRPHSQGLPEVLPDVGHTSMKNMLTQLACLQSFVVVMPFCAPG